jgi:hypothetical protein
MKNKAKKKKKYHHIVETVLNSNRKIVEIGTIDILTHIYMTVLLSCLDTGFLIKDAGLN